LLPAGADLRVGRFGRNILSLLGLGEERRSPGILWRSAVVTACHSFDPSISHGKISVRKKVVKAKARIRVANSWRRPQFPI
jgi:hypothetical protein